MKLYTDPGNFQTIKVLSAANFAGVSLQLEEVKHGSKIVQYLKESKLPVLEVFPERYIFSANAVVSCLWAKGGKPVTEEDQQWIEWESTHLAPVAIPYLVSTLGHGRAGKDLLQSMTHLLGELEKKLKGTGHLVGKEVCAADIAVFGMVYPLTQENAFQGMLEKYPAIKTWVNAMESGNAVKDAITTVTGGKGATAFKESLLTQPVPIASEGGKVDAEMAAASLKLSVSSETSEVPVERIPAEEVAEALESWNTKDQPAPLPRQHPLLPKKDKRNILITSALPYVNNVPHLGNIIGCVLSADVFSRFCRLRNYNVLYICGTDEYGTATETKALEEGVTPQEICDKYYKLHTEIYKWFNIDFDYFGRTTTQQQTEIAQDIFWRLYERDFVLKDSLEQLHCPNCDRFLADRFVEGTCPLCGFDDARGDQCDGCGKLINANELKQPRCKICRQEPSLRVSQHLFLDLPKLEPQLKVHLDRVFGEGTWTSNSKTITNAWIRDGLKPRCISRDLKWGTPVPLEGYTDKVFYVWFDAPIGYISITANYTDEWKQWWKNPTQVEMYNFLGKDNVPFHSVIFPSCLLGTDDNYCVVNHMIATEYLNYEDTKFSKSRGSGVFGDQAKDTGIQADIYRFYLVYVRPESQDSSFCWDDLMLKNNSELLNNLGNFINRALVFLANNFEGEIQPMVLEDEDKQFLALIARELKSYIDNMEQCRLRDSIRNILNISRLGNQFMQANKPWVSVKGNPKEKERAGTVVSLSVNVSCLLSVLLHPFMPVVSQTIQDQLNVPANINVITHAFICRLQPGHKIGTPSPLFQKFEASTIADLKAKFVGKPAPAKANNTAKDKPVPAATAGGDTVVNQAEVSRLTEEVSKQGIVVKELKATKAEKSKVDVEVAKLLDLKHQLALAQGLNPDAASAPSGKKKKGKK